uniref:Phage protein n=1 Tax=Pseudomonas phage PACT201 TaxID=3230130 RepID=A0AAU8GTQ8_9VIRU
MGYGWFSSASIVVVIGISFVIFSWASGCIFFIDGSGISEKIDKG